MKYECLLVKNKHIAGCVEYECLLNKKIDMCESIRLFTLVYIHYYLHGLPG